VSGSVWPGADIYPVYNETISHEELASRYTNTYIHEDLSERIFEKREEVKTSIKRPVRRSYFPKSQLQITENLSDGNV